MGKKQTFIVEIQDTQYDSWQGSIEWVQGQKKQAFRSTMELLRLIDSVTRDKDENWQELVPQATIDVVKEINGVERLKNLAIKEISELGD